MATPDTIALGEALTPQARIAAVAHARRLGLSCAECLAEIDAALGGLGLTAEDYQRRRALWWAAVGALYGLAAVRAAGALL